MLRKIISVDRDDFTKYTVCPKCCKLYTMDQCLRKMANGQTVARTCDNVIWNKTCGSKLVKEVILSNGSRHFYPLKVYCCQSIINQLEVFLKRPGFPEKCEQWRQRGSERGVLCDVYDGEVWKRFEDSDGQLFFAKARNYGLMLNVDWFQPFKHRSDYSVGVIYFVIMNLPRQERFRFENVIIGGIIPAMAKEPKLNSFLEPIVDELQLMWKGVRLLNSVTPVPLTFKAALLCVASDIPATRKICGFKSHAANLACSKCKKLFIGTIGNKDYSGFNRGSWPQRTKESHNRCSKELRDCTNKAKHEELSKKYGTYYSVLTKLEYFDAVKFHVVDPMHNLFLGIAKRMWKMWMEDVLSKQQLSQINSRIENINIATDIGRIGTNISSNYGTFTAQEWKNWTITHSMYVLSGILPEEHLRLWERFVLAARILCQRMIKTQDVLKADTLLLSFCKGYEQLYGKQSITPNLHLCCHLKQCIFDFGPIYSFWCFSFERYNGEIGSTITNNRSVEIQYMRKFVTLQCVNPINGKVPSLHRSDFQLLFDDPNASETGIVYPLSEIIVQASIPFTREVENIDWSNTSHIDCAKEHKEGAFDSDDLDLLLRAYRIMYPQTTILKSNLAFIFKQFRTISMMGEKFGSIKESRASRSARIMAIWAGDAGIIDLSAIAPRPGEVLHYFEHRICIDGVSTTHLFANVRWYRKSPYNSNIQSISYWKVHDFETGGESSFIPVQRICGRVAAGFIEKGHHKCFVPCPLPRKLCG